MEVFKVATNTPKYDRLYAAERRKRPMSKEEVLKGLADYIESQGYKPNDFKVYRYMTVHDEEAEPLTFRSLESAITNVRRNIKALQSK